MTQGPLTRVNTKVAAINLDVSRKLNWGKGLTFEFIEVDRNETGGWKVLLTLTKGFDRNSSAEKTNGDGSEVIYEVADIVSPAGTLTTVLRTKDLHVRVDSLIHKVARVSPVASNEAQLYTLTCKTRTTRTSFDATKG